jgi:putative ABC transport system permease protein
MLKNYFKIAFRNLMKYKTISFINLFGLTIGLTCCMLILTYIVNELSFDKYNKNANNIYRVERTFLNPLTKEVNLKLAACAPPFGPLIANDFKEIKNMTQVLPNGPTPFKYEEKIFDEQASFFTDQQVFDFFDINVTKGNASKALSEPFTVMLTEDIAKKYFGNEDPMNKVIRMNDQVDLKVTGIYKSFPTNSHMHPEMMISFLTLKDTTVYGDNNLKTNFGNNSFFTFIQLPANYDPKKLEAQFPAFQNRHIPNRGPNPNNIKPSDFSVLNLTKFTDIHLYSHKDDEVEENGDIKRVYIFAAIALFILIIACINYMNLSTARSVLRAKEIGVRKVVGARKPELIAQFLSESVMVAWIAMILALLITWISLPWLNSLSGQQLSATLLFKWWIIVPVLLVPFVVGLLSGLYPALFLSSFQPIKVLKGLTKVGGANISFRQVLVVVQFAVSIILIISTVVIFQQLRFMQNKSLGFNKEQIITMNLNAGLTERYESFRTEILAEPSVVNMARSSRIPSGRLLDAMGSQIKRGDSLAPTMADIKYVLADDRFLPTYGIKTVAGRNFYSDAVDTTSFLINEAAVKVLSMKSPEDAVGKQFSYGRNNGQLAGVFNDFHFESMHQRILPIVLFVPKRASNFGRVSFKVSGNNIDKSIAHIEKTWKKYVPAIPFEYTFLDERFKKLYESEQREGTIFTVFAFIAIFIACLGLFGLATFAISQRVKEIGIRKVLGASVGNVVTLVSKDFLKLVAISAIVAFPIAWYMMHNWLEDFAYRIDIAWWVFVSAGIIAAVVALVTISSQAIRAALANPVKSLRTE